MNRDIVAITSDIDWASDEVISYMLEILGEYDIRATLFCTHDISSVNGIEKHELAIHPNFFGGKTEVEVLKELKAIFPEAKGIRAHCLYHHSRLFPIYREFGIEYDSNYFTLNQTVYPFYAPHDILRIPIFFSDNWYISTHRDFTLASTDMQSQSLRVFDFHPSHIFLNRYEMSNVETTKKYRQEPSTLLTYRNIEKRGICDMFRELLEYIGEAGIKTCTLNDINTACRSKESYKQYGKISFEITDDL